MLIRVRGFQQHLGASGSSARERNVPYAMLRPTYTHEALQKLVSLGLLKHTISQNTDGLHRLSGIPRDRLSELHGNAFHERCEKCGTKYERPFVARTHSESVPDNVCVHCHCSHRTGRVCERKVGVLSVSFFIHLVVGFLGTRGRRRDLHKLKSVATPSGPSMPPPLSSPNFFTPDALPATTLPIAYLEASLKLRIINLPL